MTPQQLIGYYQRQVTDRNGCGGPVMFVCLLIVLLLMGCKTVTNEKSYIEKHRMESLVERMDSLISRSQTIQQDSSWRETFIKELRSIKERNDTSHTLVVDTSGNVIKETIIINTMREVTSESAMIMMEGMFHKMERMDSAIVIQGWMISRMDSLLQQKDKEITIEKKQSWWEGMLQQTKGIIIGIVFSGIVFFILRMKKKLP